MKTPDQFLDTELFMDIIDGKLSYNMGLDAIQTAMKEYALDVLDQVKIKIQYEREPRLNFETKMLHPGQLEDHYDALIYLNVNELKKQINHD